MLFKWLRNFVGARLTNHNAMWEQLNQPVVKLYSEGKFVEAVIVAERALAVVKRLYRGDHPNFANSLNNLAVMYNAQSRFEEAKLLHEKALAMRKRLFADDHPDVAQSLNNLAALDHSQGRYEQAESLYKETLEMTKRLFAGDHPYIFQSLNNLAGLLAATNRPSEALELIKHVTEIEDRRIRLVFAASSEKERLAYIETIRTTLERLLSLVWKYLSDSPTAVQTALDVVLKRKSLTASAFAAFNYALHSDRYSHLAADFQKFRSLRAEQIHLIYSPPLPEAGMSREEFLARQTAYKQELAELEAKCEALEERLVPTGRSNQSGMSLVKKEW